MYIDKISLTNIRGFKNLEFSLKRSDESYAGWTVFTGNNGAGKSSLLKAIAIGLKGKDAGRALQGNFHRWISEGAMQGAVELEIVKTSGDDTVVTGGAPPTQNFPARVKFTNGGRDTNIEIDLPKGKPHNYQTPQRTIWPTDSTGWFSCGYGPFRRVFGASPEATRSMVSPLTENFVTMFQEAASLAEVDSWMKDLKHKTLEDRALEAEHLKLLLGILRDDLLPEEMTVEKVDSYGLWLRDANGLLLAWTEMSDGYRAALALLADIIRHLITAYGSKNLIQKNSDGKIEITRSGVVLIDEIDAHLHPEWQRKIGFWLKSHFPKIQFIVTTHSPIICQAADQNGIFVLPSSASGEAPHPVSNEEYQKIIASKSDAILLTSAFGLENTRSPRAVASIKEYGRLKVKKDAGAKLTATEEMQLKQLQLFVLDDF